MARREPVRRKRRPGGARGAGGPRGFTASPGQPPTSQPGTPEAAPAGLGAKIAFALGAVAFLALPISYQWTFRPSSRPAGSELLLPILEVGGILAAAGALLLGRRARAAGDRSSGAVWAPRLGGAAIVGYTMAFVLLLSRSG
jgi:hypothetical protein